MSNNHYFDRLVGMSDEERDELLDFIEESLPENLAEEINQRFAERDDHISSKWIQIGRYYFLKHGNSFYAIETQMFGNNFIGAFYFFSISITDDMQDYIKLAAESELKFPNDTYKLAYGVARTLQLEEAISIKLSTNLSELYVWTRQWMLLERDN